MSKPPDFTVPYNDLVRALAATKHGVTRRSSRVEFVAESEQVTLTARDTDACVTVRVPATVKTDGVLVLDHEALTKSLRAFGTESATTKRGMSVTINAATVTAGGFTWPTPWSTDPNYDYPPLPKRGRVAFTTTAHGFVGAVRSVAAAAETSDGALSFIRASGANGNLDLVATDRFVLGTNRVPIEAAAPVEMLLPSEPMHWLCALLPRFGGTVEVTDDDNYVTFVCGDLTVTVRSGWPTKYPDIARLLEPRNDHITVDRAALSKAVTTAAALSTANGNWSAKLVRLVIGPDGVRVDPVHRDVVSTGPVIPGTSSGYTGSVEFFANTALLSRLFGSMTSDQVVLSFDPPRRRLQKAPRPLEVSDGDLRWLVMPARVLD